MALAKFNVFSFYFLLILFSSLANSTKTKAITSIKRRKEKSHTKSEENNKKLHLLLQTICKSLYNTQINKIYVHAN